MTNSDKQKNPQATLKCVTCGFSSHWNQWRRREWEALAAARSETAHLLNFSIVTTSKKTPRLEPPWLKIWNHPCAVLRGSLLNTIRLLWMIAIAEIRGPSEIARNRELRRIRFSERRGRAVANVGKAASSLNSADRSCTCRSCGHRHRVSRSGGRHRRTCVVPSRSCLGHPVARAGDWPVLCSGWLPRHICRRWVPSHSSARRRMFCK